MKVVFGLGTTTPMSKLDVEGGVAIGSSYSGTTAAPTNGLLVEGNVGIGTNEPQNKLDVEGGMVVGSGYSGTSNCSNQWITCGGKCRYRNK